MPLYQVLADNAATLTDAPDTARHLAMVLAMIHADHRMPDDFRWQGWFDTDTPNVADFVLYEQGFDGWEYRGDIHVTLQADTPSFDLLATLGSIAIVYRDFGTSPARSLAKAYTQTTLAQ